MRVEISPAASRDLEEIGDVIATDNPQRAASFVDELIAACLALDHHPDRFPVVIEVDEP